MSREIKFRAWDKIELEMCEVDTLNWNMSTAMLKREGVDAYGILNKDVILMQYTGIKDKEGVDIYEGDWARMPFFWRYKVDGVDIEEEGYYEGEVVIIASKGVCLRNPRRHKYNLTNDTPEEIVKLKQYQSISGYCTKVIGNIHQHKHLLGG